MHSPRRQHRLSTSSGPFVGYRVSLASHPDAPAALTLASPSDGPAELAPLLGGQRDVFVSEAEAAGVYDWAERAARAASAPVPLRFVPVRAGERSRAAPFVGVPFLAGEVLHLVHEGFFGSQRGREAAIAAVAWCGAAAVDPLDLAAVRRGALPGAAARYVDALIEGEAELRASGVLG